MFKTYSFDLVNKMSMKSMPFPLISFLSLITTPLRFTFIATTEFLFVCILEGFFRSFYREFNSHLEHSTLFSPLVDISLCFFFIIPPFLL